jgi:hypothetical protein
MGVLQFIADLVESVVAVFYWRDDWNRTWSPVSYWLAVAALGALILFGVLYGHVVWEAIQEHWRAGK